MPPVPLPSYLIELIRAEFISIVPKRSRKREIWRPPRIPSRQDGNDNCDENRQRNQDFAHLLDIAFYREWTRQKTKSVFSQPVAAGRSKLLGWQAWDRALSRP